MSFCIIANITKVDLCLRYQVDGGPIETLKPGGDSKIPLAFCLSGDELLMNKFASEQARLGAGNAYTDYFTLIKDRFRSFRFAGEDKPIKQLLYYGLEGILSYFLREVVYDNTPIESYRKSLPLRFAFGDDISNDERRFVIDLFREQGYGNVAEANITDSVFDTLLQRFGGPILTLSGIGGDLYSNFYANRKSPVSQTKRIANLGKDQRLSVCADLMYENIDERYGSPFPVKDDIMPILLREAADNFANDNSPVVSGRVFGPDGLTYEYEVLSRLIERRLSKVQEENQIVNEVKYFLKRCGVESKNTAAILKDDLVSEYFLSLFRPEFYQVVSMDEINEKGVWEEVFRRVDFTPPEISIVYPSEASFIRTPVQGPSEPPVLPPIGEKSVPKVPPVQGPSLPYSPSSSGMKTPKAPDMPPILPSSNRKESPKAPDVPPVLPPISGNRTQQVIPRPPVTPAPTKKVNTPSAPPAPPVMPTPTKKVNTPIPTPPPPPVSIQPKTTQPAPPKKPASNTPSAAASAKESVSKVVGGLFDAGKKSLGDMGDKIKTGGLAGGMMSSIKGVVANLSDNVVVVGRKGEQKMAITENTVSREHCTLKLMRNGKVEVEDLSSKNGTFINDIRITKAVVDQEDIIRLGPIFKAKVKDLLVVK